MLVLSRKLGEQIRIGLGIEITVLKIHGGRVQIGVQAPREVSVRRDDCRSTTREREMVSCSIHE